MTELLTRLFIRDRDNVQDPAVRRQYGTLSGLCGICLNILLFLGKFIAGTVSGSAAGDGVLLWKWPNYLTIDKTAGHAWPRPAFGALGYFFVSTLSF